MRYEREIKERREMREMGSEKEISTVCGGVQCYKYPYKTSTIFFISNNE